MEYTITHNNLHIKDSYKVKKTDLMEINLYKIQVYAHQNGADQHIFEVRSIESMVDEWATHNLLYNLHIKRERTADVDINEISKFWKFVYWFVSLFYWH